MPDDPRDKVDRIEELKRKLMRRRDPVRPPEKPILDPYLDKGASEPPDKDDRNG